MPNFNAQTPCCVRVGVLPSCGHIMKVHRVMTETCTFAQLLFSYSIFVDLFYCMFPIKQGESEP